MRRWGLITYIGQPYKAGGHCRNAQLEVKRIGSERGQLVVTKNHRYSRLHPSTIGVVKCIVHFIELKDDIDVKLKVIVSALVPGFDNGFL